MIPSLLAALLLQTAPTAAPVCTATAPPPVGLEAWNEKATGVSPTTGKPEAVDLTPIGGVKFGVTPGRPPAAETFGGIYPVTIAKAGTYRIVLSAGAWIDLIDRTGASLKSVAHTEGPACSGIRKIVDFDLVPGAYTLQLSGAKAAPVRVLIAPK
ncbi:MAG: hypothetical protein V4459_09500 [Pseudomonadota bacterium]